MLQLVIALLMIQQHAIMASEKQNEKWKEVQYIGITLNKTTDIRNKVGATDEENIGLNLRGNGGKQDKNWMKTELEFVSDVMELATNDIGADLEESTHQKLKRGGEKLDEDWEEISITSENMKLEMEGATKSTGQKFEKRNGMQYVVWKETRQMGSTLDEKDFETKEITNITGQKFEKLDDMQYGDWKETGQMGITLDKKDFETKDTTNSTGQKFEKRDGMQYGGWKETGQKAITLDKKDFETKETTNITGQKFEKRDGMQYRGWKETRQTGITLDKKDFETKGTGTDTDDSTGQKLETRTGSCWSRFTNNRKNVEEKVKNEPVSKKRNWHCYRRKTSPSGSFGTGATAKVKRPIKELFLLKPRADGTSRIRNKRRTAKSSGSSQAKCKSYLSHGGTRHGDSDGDRDFESVGDDSKFRKTCKLVLDFVCCRWWLDLRVADPRFGYDVDGSERSGGDGREHGRSSNDNLLMMGAALSL